MSNIAISGNTSGTGTFILEAPATNNDRNITLADASGNVVVSDGTTITADYTNNRFSFGGTVVFNGLTTGFNRWQILNANTNLVANKNYFANTQTTLTLTLPATANIGDTIRVFDNEGYASANVVTINRNGNKIDGFDRNVVISTDRDGVELVYVAPDVGFVSREQKTEGRFFGTQAQGEVSAFVLGGNDPTPAGVFSDQIEKFPFASDNNAVVSGVTLTRGQRGGAGIGSLTDGYHAGGGYHPGTPPTIRTSQIEKFPFSADSGVAVDIGDLAVGTVTDSAGCQSAIEGFSIGGNSAPGNGNHQTQIDKFPFATDTNASDSGLDLTQARSQMGSSSSTENGYVMGGFNGPPGTSQINNMNKFPFASSTGTSNIGNLSETLGYNDGASSKTDGYSLGGYANPPLTSKSNIEKFPFASDTNASNVASLTQARYGLSGHSSLAHGYGTGGSSAGVGQRNTIDKHSFASDANATDVGDLTKLTNDMSGTEV